MTESPGVSDRIVRSVYVQVRRMGNPTMLELRRNVTCSYGSLCTALGVLREQG